MKYVAYIRTDFLGFTEYKLFKGNDLIENYLLSIETDRRLKKLKAKRITCGFLKWHFGSARTKKDAEKELADND